MIKTHKEIIKVVFLLESINALSPSEKFIQLAILLRK
jgi:hypothetical protein